MPHFPCSGHFPHETHDIRFRSEHLDSDSLIIQLSIILSIPSRERVFHRSSLFKKAIIPLVVAITARFTLL